MTETSSPPPFLPRFFRAFLANLLSRFLAFGFAVREVYKLGMKRSQTGRMATPLQATGLSRSGVLSPCGHGGFAAQRHVYFVRGRRCPI